MGAILSCKVADPDILMGSGSEWNSNFMPKGVLQKIISVTRRIDYMSGELVVLGGGAAQGAS